jgi:hypothetical protein
MQPESIALVKPLIPEIRYTPFSGYLEVEDKKIFLRLPLTTTSVYKNYIKNLTATLLIKAMFTVFSHCAMDLIRSKDYYLGP